MSSSPATPPTAPTPALVANAIAIVGPSNSGKTELICRLLEWFTAQGARVAVLKHSHQLHLADESKDTGRYRHSGGRLVALAAPGLVQITRTFPEEPPLLSILAELAPEADLILVEGYKTSDLPKLALVATNLASLPNYPGVVAWISSGPLPVDLPVFNPGQVSEIGRFILAQVQNR